MTNFNDLTTTGEWIVGTSLNPSNNGTVDEVKGVVADLIDLLIEEVYPISKDPVSVIKAVDALELAAMFAVKAITKTTTEPVNVKNDPTYKSILDMIDSIKNKKGS